MTTLLADGQVSIDIAGQAVSQGLTTSNQNIGTLIATILGGVAAVGALAVLIFLVWGSFEWILAGGDKTKVETARNKITGAIVGFIVLLCSWAIFLLVQHLTGVQLSPTTPTTK